MLLYKDFAKYTFPVSKLGRHLTGNESAERHLTELRRFASSVPAGEIFTVDFKGVSTVDSSWFWMTTVPLIGHIAGENNDVYPIVSRLDGRYRGELEDALHWGGSCMAVASSTFPDRFQTLYVLGMLEGALFSAIRFVTEAGEISAEGLAEARKLWEGSMRPITRSEVAECSGQLEGLYAQRLVRRIGGGHIYNYRALAPAIAVLPELSIWECQESGARVWHDQRDYAKQDS